MTSTKTSGLRSAWLAIVVAVAAAACALACAMPAQAQAYEVKQTGVTANSITIAWDQVSGATEYGVAYTDGTTTYGPYYTTATKHQLTGLKAGASFDAKVVYYTGSTYYTVGYSYDLCTAPTAPKDIKVGARNTGSSYPIKIQAVRTSDYYTCHQFSLKNLKTGAVRTVNTDKYTNIASFSSPAAAAYSIQVRDFVTINGVNVYSSWTPAKTYVCQPKSKKAKLKKGSKVQLRWSKVAGATGYEIYMSTKSTSGFKKIATVKSSKSSYTVSKFKKKSFKKWKTYYYKVVAKKGAVKSPKDEWGSFYIYTKYV